MQYEVLGTAPTLDRNGALLVKLARVHSPIAGAGVCTNRAAGLVAAVVKGNDTVLMKAYGRADVEWDVPMSVNAMLEVGSIAKQFTAASILQLRDAGTRTSRIARTATAC